MNIKFCLLPDGDDPDSFARKHNAEEFRRFITEHEQDFIRFKTDLLLKGTENDPLKRAELIDDIVGSISVIPNNIVRQTYIQECASRLQVGEDLIVSEINKRKASPRPADRKAAAAQVAQRAASPAPLLAQTPMVNREEELLITMVVRYGESLIHCAEEGEEDSQMTVAQSWKTYDKRRYSL